MARRRDENGLVGIVLTIVIVFALIAVVELTRTVVAAQQINRTVVDITGSVGGINQHLNSVPELDKTNATAAAILEAAKPLTGQAGQIIDAAGKINTIANTIQTNAVSINGTVHSISSTAGGINSTVHSIDSTFVTLAPIVGPGGNSIQQNVVAINQRVDVAMGLINGIKGDTGNIALLVNTPGTQNSIAGQAQGICSNGLVNHC